MHGLLNVKFNTFVDTKIVNLAFVEAKELYCGISQPALCPRFALASELISQSILSREEHISVLHDSPWTAESYSAGQEISWLYAPGMFVVAIILVLRQVNPVHMYHVLKIHCSDILDPPSCSFPSVFLFDILYACFASHRFWAFSTLPDLNTREEKNQLDATEWFIALLICSTWFGHFYAHHQEFETICVLLPPVVCSALVAGCRRSGAGSRLCVRDEGCCTTESSNIHHPERIACCLHLTSDNQQPRHCTPQAAITHIVSSSWWWA